MKLGVLLDQWPSSRTWATARQVAELTGFLLHVSFAMRPGKFFVGRLLAAVGMPQSAVFPSGVVNPHQRVTLGPLFHDELEFWRWFVAIGLDKKGESFSYPMYNILIRPPSITVFSDVEASGRGLLCRERLVLSIRPV